MIFENDQGAFRYELVEDGAVITSCKAAGDELIVPDTIDGVPVVEIDLMTIKGPVFSRLHLGPSLRRLAKVRAARSVAETIEIDPANPELVSDGAGIYGEGGAALLVLAVPAITYEVRAGCRRIGRFSLSCLRELHGLRLPDGLEEIDDFAMACSGLERLETPATLRRIGTKAFLHCVHLTSVALNAGLAQIGDAAFRQCPVERLVVPASVAEIGRGVVTNDSMVIAADNPRYFIDDGLLYERLDAEGRYFRLLDCLDAQKTSAAPLEGTVTVGDEAFYHHPSLETIELPATVTTVGVQAFRGARRLSEATLPDGLRAIAAKAFAGTRLAAITLPRELASLGLNALLTQGDERLCPPPYLKSVAIAPGNPRFYMESGLLCERDTADQVGRVQGFSAYADAATLAPMAFVGRGGETPDEGIEYFAAPSVGANEAVEDGETADGAADSYALVNRRPEAVNDGLSDGDSIIGSVHDLGGERLAASAVPEDAVGAGGDTLVQYCGRTACVTVPPQVSAIAPYAFAGVRSIRELTLHPHIRTVGLCAFAIGAAIPLVHLELEEPTEGRRVLDIYFPDNDYGARALEYAMAGGMASPAAFCSYWDDAIIKTEDPYERGRLLLGRLADPVYLEEDHREQFFKLLRAHAKSFAKAFAAHNYTVGFDRLIAEGVLDEGNIIEVIDHLSGDEVEMTGYLLEMKRRHFGGAALDFSL